MPLVPGTRIASYEISSSLGAGGMGEVYRARDTKLGRDVAIKTLPPSLVNDAEYLTRFQREAQILASLNHPNIAAIYGLEDNAIVMELVEGETLSGPLGLAQALPIAKQIAEALEAAHERGIIHRDLKPGNIKITPEGVVKVLDFGLAKAVEPAAKSAVADSPTMTIHATQSGIILGTAGYMSPEQAAGKPVDKRADIWSFGVVLWEMLTGKPAFEGETVSHTLAHVLTREINLDDAPASVRPLLRRCLDRNVKTRLRDIGEARVEIDKLLSGATPAQPAAARSPRRRASWLPWAVALAASALTLAVAAWFFRAEPDRDVVEFQIPQPEQGRYTRLAISPDGRKIIMIHAGIVGGARFYLRRIDSSELRPIAAITGDVLSAFWSPDSQRIAFFADGKMKTAGLDGGAATVLCDAIRSSTGAWGSSGVILFSQPRGPIWKVADTGGTASEVLPLDGGRGETSQRSPVFLPDGKRFFYESLAAQKPGVYLASLDGGKPELVLEGVTRLVYTPSPKGESGYLTYFRQGQIFARAYDPSASKFLGAEMLVAANVVSGIGQHTWSVARGVLGYLHLTSAASSTLSWVSRKGETIRKFDDADRVQYSEIRLDPTNTKAAFSPNAPTANIWLLDLERSSTSRLTFGPGGDGSPVWSPDGASVAYGSYGAGTYRIYRRAADGTGKEEVLLSSKDEILPASWSSDGKWLLYLSGTPGRWDQYILPLSAGGKPTPFVIDSYDKYDAQFSPDGRWIAYSSNESGHREVYVQPVPQAAGGTPGLQGKWQISKEGGVHARWRKDGKELFFIGGVNRIMAAAVDTTATSFRSSTPVALFPVQVVSTPASLYDVAADGSKFLVLNRSRESSYVNIVLNWESRLK